jgi:hypothetical protein
MARPPGKARRSPRARTPSSSRATTTSRRSRWRSRGSCRAKRTRRAAGRAWPATTTSSWTASATGRGLVLPGSQAGAAEIKGASRSGAEVRVDAA